MNFMLNGRVVSVTDRMALGLTPADGSIVFRVAVDGNYVGTRPTMAGALALATHMTHPAVAADRGAL